VIRVLDSRTVSGDQATQLGVQVLEAKDHGDISDQIVRSYHERVNPREDSDDKELKVKELDERRLFEEEYFKRNA
jgi:hypothetical protein